MSSQKKITDVPFAFSAVYRINPGAEDELSALVAEYVEAVHSSSRGALALSTGLSDDGKNFVVTALHDNTRAMEEHLTVVGPFIERTNRLAFAETITVVGSPGPLLASALEANGAAGTSVTVIERGQGFAGVHEGHR